MAPLVKKGNEQAIISQPNLRCKLAPQFPTSKHPHDFFVGIFTQHRLRQLECSRIIDRSFVSDLSVSPKVCLAAACQDNGIGTVFVGRDAVRGFIDDAIAIGSGRLEPPTICNVR